MISFSGDTCPHFMNTGQDLLSQHVMKTPAKFTCDAPTTQKMLEAVPELVQIVLTITGQAFSCLKKPNYECIHSTYIHSCWCWDLCHVLCRASKIWIINESMNEPEMAGKCKVSLITSDVSHVHLQVRWICWMWWMHCRSIMNSTPNSTEINLKTKERNQLFGCSDSLKRWHPKTWISNPASSISRLSRPLHHIHIC